MTTTSNVFIGLLLEQFLVNAIVHSFRQRTECSTGGCIPMNNRFGVQIMKKLLIAAGFIMAGVSAASAQGYVVYGPPAVAVYPAAPAYGLYDYAPGYATTTYGYYPPVRWYGSFDESGNSYRQPGPRSTIRAVR
jgi:hypothetical protein